MSTVMISPSRKQQAQQLARLLRDVQQQEAADDTLSASESIELPTGYFWLVALGLIALGGYLFSFLTPCRP